MEATAERQREAGSTERAHDLFQRLKQIRKQQEGTKLEAGEILLEIQKEALFEELGHDSFSSFLGDPDIDLTRTTSYRYMGVFQELYRERDYGEEFLQEIGMSKAYKIVNALRDGLIPEDELEDWLHSAKELSRSDLNEELDELRGNTKQEDEDDEEVEKTDVTPGWIDESRECLKQLKKDPEDTEEMRRLFELIYKQADKLSLLSDLLVDGDTFPPPLSENKGS